MAFACTNSGLNHFCHREDRIRQYNNVGQTIKICMIPSSYHTFLAPSLFPPSLSAPISIYIATSLYPGLSFFFFFCPPLSSSIPFTFSLFLCFFRSLSISSHSHCLYFSLLASFHFSLFCSPAHFNC